MSNTTSERRRPSTVVTSQNLAEYQAKELDRIAPIPANPVKADEPVKVEPEKVEAKADESESEKSKKAEPEKDVDDVEKPVEAKKEPEKVLEKKTVEDDEKDDKKQSKLSERMHELAEKAKAEKVKREDAERRIAELEARLAPTPPKVEESPKPKKEDFSNDPDQYAEKLAEWTVTNILRERDKADAAARAKAHQDSINSAWMSRLQAIQAEVPDFADKIKASTITISDEIRDVIMESEVGPRILLHLAEHPEEADKIGRLTVGKAYIALGKLEAILSAPVKVTEKEVIEPEKPVKPVKQVEVSKAPPPISPLKGANAPIDLPIVDGVWKGTHEQYKEARRAGKIK